MMRTLMAQRSPELDTWVGLNEALMEGDQGLAERLLKEELKDRKRKQFVLRLHSRINKLRADAERAELLRKLA